MINDGPLRQPEYLSTVQYAASGNLDNRSQLHDRYSSSSVPFRVWEAGLVEWPDGGDVLEVGAGPGHFWAIDSLPRSLRIAATDLSVGMVADAPGHMRQLDDAIAEVFHHASSGLNGIFGIDNGEFMLREVFSTISWHSFVNPLMVTNADHLLAYATSLPPSQDGSPEQLERLSHVFQRELQSGQGTMRIDTRTGAFICRNFA